MKTRAKAILWLHAIRLGRYKYGFANMILTDLIWYMLFLLGALMFVPEGELAVYAVITFWGVVLWSIMNNCVWLISGWVWFVVATGIIEDHIVHGVNPMMLIMGRAFTSMSVSLVAIPVIALVFTGIAGPVLLNVYNALALLAGIILMFCYASLYAVILASISIRTHVPGVMLDITNIFMYIAGGLGVPVSRMPQGLREASLAIPYTHAAEITRYGVLGIEPYIGLGPEAFIAVVYLAALAAVATASIMLAEKYMRTHGIKGVGRM